MGLREVPDLNPEKIRRHRCRLSLLQVVGTPRHVSGAPARGGIPERWDQSQDRQSGGWPRPPRPAIVCSCREAVTERDDLTPDKPARPPRRRGRRRRKPVSSPPAPAGGLIPPVIKVEIQNIERLAGRDDSAVAEREAQVSAATRELEEREARLAASAVELRERERRVEELEDALGPAADMLESRESIDRRERRVRELETSLRDRAQDLEQRENDHEARKAVVEADLELREEEVERREDLLAIREERLEERQRELGVYVSQLQSRFEPQA